MNKLEKKIVYQRRSWILSFLTTIFLAIILVTLWFFIEHRYLPSPHQISDQAGLHLAVDEFIDSTTNHQQLEKPMMVPTGVFLQSVEFLSSNTVQVSGYVWQKISNENLAKGINPGVVFPEAKEEVMIEPAYTLEYDNYKLYGWNFTGVSLLQNFNYSAYPFDIHSIWIRLWPKDFYRNIILVPDLAAYDSTKPGQIFGLEKDIVRQGFTFKETFFDMPVMTYDTNFGIQGDVGQKRTLELFFNTIIERDLFTPFIIHLLPLALIWVILFLITMMITIDGHLVKREGLSLPNIFSVLGATVFSVLILHIGFRRGFIEQPLLYLEYFYLITYLFIIVIAFDVYTVTNTSNAPRLIKSNILKKTRFWPSLFFAIVVITIIEFYIFPENSIHWYT